MPQEVAVDYGAPGDSSHTMTTMDGTVYKEFYGTGYQRGLVTQTEVWGKDNPNDQSSPSIKQKWTTNTWTQDNTGVSYQTNPRVTETNVFDASGNRRRATTTYASFTLPSGASCPLPTDTREYATDAMSVLRQSHVTYKMDPASDASYLDRHIIGIVKEQTLYEVSGGGEALMSKLAFSYDETGSIQGNDSPVRHDSSYDGNFVVGRANLTSVKRYDVTNTSQWTISSLQYNTAGGVVKKIDPLGHFNTISYADSFSDGNDNRSTLAYPKVVNDADGYSTILIYNFDFGALTSKQTPQPNIVQNVPGPTQTFTYDTARRPERMTAVTNGAYTRYLYGPNYVTSWSTVNNAADEAFSTAIFDGMGRTFLTAKNHPVAGGLIRYSAVNTIYDKVGNAVKQSNPTETTSAWLPAGDDQNGWLYTQQTYDWKGRPLRTTNTDTTYNEASYAGCGCAGGEVVTLTDEGTLVNGFANKRQEKIYSDILGRTFKSETLNWEGSGIGGVGRSVYSTSITTYNGRDQVTRVREFDTAQGTVPADPNDLSCPTGSCQQTTMTYDGFGRLKTKHAPEQDDDTSTTFNYNSDDTTSSVVDARGSASTFTYNARSLVTHIAYDPSAGVTDTLDVMFTYDAAGNRSLMTDALGSQSYQYDQLSRMSSETRIFSGFGTYAINYAYNLANELTSITDPFGAQVGYNYDVAGRVNSVTGSGFGNISTYASSFQYRAGGQLSHLTFGNYNQPLSANYNARLKPTSFTALGISMTYQYYDDGRLKFSQDNFDHRFDRSYSYDHAGRLTSAYSGAEARLEGTTDNRPYKQDYAFDAWDNLISRTGKHWSHNNPFLGSYLNNRMDGWQYDADGRNTSSDSVNSTFDAAGLLIQTNGPQRRNNPPLVLQQGFDGDGQRIKKVEYGETYYLVRSTVVGHVITEIYGSANQFYGQKQRGHAYVNGSELAQQNPSGDASYVFVDPSGVNRALQLDPLGNAVGEEDPYLPDGGGDPGFNYPHFGDMSDGGYGCTVDGEPWPCTFAFKYAGVRPSRISVNGPYAWVDVSYRTVTTRAPGSGNAQPSSGAGGKKTESTVANTGGFTGGAPFSHVVSVWTPVSYGKVWKCCDDQGNLYPEDQIFSGTQYSVTVAEPQDIATYKEFHISHTGVLDLIKKNNQSTASNGVILCQAFKESRAQGGVDHGKWYAPPLGTFNNASQGSVSHRGLMQIGPVEAQLGGLGNGQGDGFSDDRLAAVNPDYINNIWDPASNIRAGSGYLQHLIARSKNEVKTGLIRYRSGSNTKSPVGNAYATNILDCAAKVDAGDNLGGLGLIK